MCRRKIMEDKTIHFVCILLSLSAFVTCYMYGKFLFSNEHICGMINEQYSSETLSSFNVKRTNLSSKSPEPLDTMTKNKCKGCMTNVPNVIVQFGSFRTASTLQFQILCLMMAMLHEDKIRSVGCHFGIKPKQNFSVIKTHTIGFLLKSLPKTAWVFMTTKDNQSKDCIEQKQRIEQQNRTIQLIVDTGMVSRRGHFIAYDYQSIFGMSDAQMTNIVTYLRYWDILRRCCGKQMSTDWRNHLSPIPNYTQHYEPNNIAYPACELYNISAVEKLFINTFIYKRFSPVKSLRDTIGKPSTVDGELTGHYCEHCNRNIAKRHLHKLNENCS